MSFHWLRPLIRRWTTEQKNQRNAAERKQAEQIKIIHERPQMRLRIKRAVNGRVSLLRCSHRISLMRKKIFCRGESLRESRVGCRQMPDHERLMFLCAAREHRRDKRDADAAAEIAHEIVKSAGVSNLLLAELAHRRRRQRNENETDGHAVDDARPDDAHVAHL